MKQGGTNLYPLLVIIPHVYVVQVIASSNQDFVTESMQSPLPPTPPPRDLINLEM